MQGVKIGSAIAYGAALGGDETGDHFVPGGVGLHVFANPGVVGLHRGWTELRTVDQEQVGPFVGPVIDEFRAGEERVDQSSAFVSAGVFEERFDFFGGG